MTKRGWGVILAVSMILVAIIILSNLVPAPSSGGFSPTPKFNPTTTDSQTANPGITLTSNLSTTQTAPVAPAPAPGLTTPPAPTTGLSDGAECSSASQCSSGRCAISATTRKGVCTAKVTFSSRVRSYIGRFRSGIGSYWGSFRGWFARIFGGTRSSAASQGQFQVGSGGNQIVGGGQALGGASGTIQGSTDAKGSANPDMPSGSTGSSGTPSKACVNNSQCGANQTCNLLIKKSTSEPTTPRSNRTTEKIQNQPGQSGPTVAAGGSATVTSGVCVDKKENVTSDCKDSTGICIVSPLEGSTISLETAQNVSTFLRVLSAQKASCSYSLTLGASENKFIEDAAGVNFQHTIFMYYLGDIKEGNQTVYLQCKDETGNVKSREQHFTISASATAAQEDQALSNVQDIPIYEEQLGSDETQAPGPTPEELQATETKKKIAEVVGYGSILVTVGGLLFKLISGMIQKRALKAASSPSASYPTVEDQQTAAVQAGESPESVFEPKD